MVEEAVNTRTAAVISYHPPIFKPLSSFTLTNPLQRSLLLCAAQGISVFSPHTALDSVKGGINDWLSDIVQTVAPGSVGYVGAPKDDDLGGEGRLVRFRQPVELKSLVDAIKKGLALSAGMCLPSAYLSFMRLIFFSFSKFNLPVRLPHTQKRSRQWLYAREVVVLCYLVSMRMCILRERCPTSVFFHPFDGYRWS